MNSAHHQNPPPLLTPWDHRLLRRHLAFYRSLDTRERRPTSQKQCDFLEVCRGTRRPSTQHEIAYRRYLDLRRYKASLAAQTDAASHAPAEIDIPALTPPQSVIASVRHLGLLAHCDRVLRRVQDAYDRSASSFRDYANEAAIWINATLAEQNTSAAIERLLGHSFNHLSNYYTQAMDQPFLDGLRGLGPLLSPTTHRHIDGGHTLVGAWEAVRNALSEDTLGQEVAGYFRALASDLSSRAGLPLVTLSQDNLLYLTSSLHASLSIPKAWTLDALSYTAPELLGCSLGVIAAALNWTKADTDRFARLTASLGLSTMVSANPLLAIVTLVLAAKAFQEAKTKDEYEEAALGFAKGGILTGSVLATGALVGGPVWVGLVTGVCVGVFVHRKTREIDADKIKVFVEGRLRALAKAPQAVELRACAF